MGKYNKLTIAFTAYHEQLAVKFNTTADTIEYLRRAILQRKETPLKIREVLQQKNVVLLKAINKTHIEQEKKNIMAKINRNIARMRFLDTIELEAWQELITPKQIVL